jgi:hypothetical protein
LVDQFELPGSPPSLQTTLARTGFKGGWILLKIDEVAYAIGFGEACHELALMLKDESD